MNNDLDTKKDKFIKSNDLKNNLKNNLKNKKYNFSKSYKHCLQIAKNHYENFPVASIFLPKRIRNAVAAIYAFARSADDFSDEGNLTINERLDLLNNCEKKLELIKENKIPNDQIYKALYHSIHFFNLPINLFFDLLKAFKQDVVKNSYENFDEVLNYCKHSANPIGRLLLYLTENANEENFILSDKICTSLQLINFLQDLHLDAKTRNRNYMPKDEMQKFEFTFKDILIKNENDLFSKFINLQIKKAEKLMSEGKAFGSKLTGFFGFEIRLIILGGEKIIKELYNRENIYEKPIIRKLNWFKMFFQALTKSTFSNKN